MLALIASSLLWLASLSLSAPTIGLIGRVGDFDDIESLLRGNPFQERAITATPLSKEDIAEEAFDAEIFKKELMLEYNFYRDLHESAPLSLDKKLCRRAALWAEYLATAPSDKCLHHSLYGGENIYFFWSTRAINETELARKACKAFYEEVKFYNYEEPGMVWPAAHFTEMVWKSVKKMGVGVFKTNYIDEHGACRIQGTAERPATGYFVVVHHLPRGNIMSPREFAANVLPPKGNFTE